MTERTDVSGSLIASEHIHQITVALNNLDVELVDRIFSLLKEVRDKRKTVFIAGNGGSSSTATHWANDLAKATKRSGRRRIQFRFEIYAFRRKSHPHVGPLPSLKV